MSQHLTHIGTEDVVADCDRHGKTDFKVSVRTYRRKSGKVMFSRVSRCLKCECEARNARKRELVDFMGGKCEGCAGKVPLIGFDFHHVGKKRFKVSGSNLLRRIETLYAEIAKCRLLCAVCHRQVHAGELSLSARDPV